MLQSVRNPQLLFLALAGGIYTAALLTFARGSELASPLDLGLALDLAITVPLLAYLLPVRRAGWPYLVVPVLMLAGVATVRKLAPAGLPLPEFAFVAVMLGLACAVLVGGVARVARVWRGGAGGARGVAGANGVDLEASAAPDPLERLQLAAREVVPVALVADLIAHELAMIYYALLAWRAAPAAPRGARAFSYHRRAGYGAVVFAIVLLCVAEGAAVHLLVSLWSPAVAWVLTILTLYGALWFVADYRASVLRPVLVTADALVVRTGVRWTAVVPRARIVAVHLARPDTRQRVDGRVLHATLVGTPSLWIELSEPVRASGPYGVAREARWLALGVDEAAELAISLSPR
jgi:hypothetical protein